MFWNTPFCTFVCIFLYAIHSPMGANIFIPYTLNPGQFARELQIDSDDAYLCIIMSHPLVFFMF